MASRFNSRPMIVTAALVLMVLAFFCRFSSGWPLVLHELIWGWLGFAWRVAPNVNVRFDGLLIFVLGSIFFSLLLHWILAWLFASDPSSSADDERKKWRFKWSIMIVMGIELLFVAGIGATGIVHQSAWLLRDKQPIYGSSLDGDYVSSRDKLRSNILDINNYHDIRRSIPRNSKHHSWITESLYASQYGVTFGDIDQSQAWDSPVNRKHFKKPNPLYLNPSLVFDSIHDHDGFGLSHFAGNKRIFSSNQKLMFKQIPNPSNTIMIGEINSGFSPWGKPANTRDVTAPMNSPNGFGEVTTGGITFAFADGSAARVNSKIDRDIYRSYAGEFIESPRTDNQ